MKTPFYLLLSGIIFLAGCGQPPDTSAPISPENSSANDAGKSSQTVWLTDFQKAKSLAAEENKLVLMNFTGSDWCPPCQMLKKDILSTSEFDRFAEEHLVLVELDFPRKKAQPEELKKQNERLSQSFGIEGFPTLVLLDKDARELARSVGYMSGGPKGFMDWVEAARPK